MTPQERQMIDDLFDRLAKLESAPRDPEAPAARHRITTSSSSYMVMINTLMSLSNSLIWMVASRPFNSGMDMSISTMSGRTRLVSATASRPLAASLLRLRLR